MGDMDTHTDTMERDLLMLRLSLRLMLLTTDMLLMPHTPMDMVLVLLLTPDTLPPLLPDLPRDLERGLLSLSMDTELSQSPEPPLDTDLLPMALPRDTPALPAPSRLSPDSTKKSTQ